MSRIMNSSALPSAMEQKLRQIRWRQTLLATVQAVAVSASVLIVAMVVAMVFDWSVTLFSTGVRTSLTLGAIVLAVGTLIVVGLPPLLAALRITQAASNADDEIPQLEERWTTVTSFAKSEHQPTSKTGQAMLQQVTSEAVAMGRLVRPTQVARPMAIRPAAVMLGACGLVLAAFLAVNWPQTSVLMQRFWSPATNITATQLKSVTGDVEVPRGESLDLVTELSGLPRKTAMLELATGDEFVDSFELTPDENQASAFIHQLTADEPFRYRVIAGDGQTPWHTVGVIDHPALGEVQLTITAPKYVDRPKYEKSLIPSRVRVIQGSRLELSMKPVATLKRLELALTREGQGDDDPVETMLELEPDADGWYRYETQLIEDVAFQPTLVNSHGLTNEDRHRCRIQVIPDKPPFARIISPTNEMAVAYDDVIDVKAELHDDQGIASAELVVYDESSTEDGEEPKVLEVIPIPLGDQKFEKHAMVEAQLDLNKLGVKEGANISYTIRVTDTRMLEIDPDNTLAQMSEAMSDRPDEETQSTESTDEGDSSKSKGKAPEDGREASDPAAEDMKNMLASASEIDEDQRAARDSAEGKPDTEAGNNESTSSDNPEQTAPAGSKTGDEKSNNDSDNAEAGSKNPESDGEPAEPKGDASAEGKADESKDSVESDRQGVRAVAKTSSDTKKADSEQKDSSNAKPTEDKSSSPSGEKEDDPESSQGSDTPAGSSGKNENPSSDTPDGSQPEDRDPKNPEDNPVAVADTTNQKDMPPGETEPVDNNAVAGASKGQNNSEDPTDRSDENSSERDAENAKKMMAQAKKDDEKPSDDEPADNEPGSSSSSGSTNTDQNEKKDRDPREPSENDTPRNVRVALTPQQSESGQNTETRKQKLKITQRLTAVAASSGRKQTAMKIRDKVVHIDEMLAESETALQAVVDRNIPDADRSEQFRILDKQLGDIETYIAELRNETKEQQFAFVGLQMVHIGRTHVTPARDRTYIAIREPLGTDNPTVALHHVVRAREKLGALLKRYDRVAQDKELADALDESIEMYEVMVEKSQQLMREARQNRNPLKRKMAIIEVDQAYLDRYAEVATMRREMLAELGRMLGEDPRLLSRYLDIVRRRRNSLRDQLSEIAERQDEITTELSNWLLVEDDQRADFWGIIAELRMHAATPLAKEAAGLAERIEQSMPLILKTDQGTASLVIEHAQKIARVAREITFDKDKFLQQAGEDDKSFDLVTKAEQLSYLFGELDAALEQLNFENDESEETESYVTARLLESRTVADQADAWSQFAGQLESGRYAGLAEVDQQAVALLTELLRIEMLGMEDELNGQFQQTADTNLPGEIADMIRELHRVMETITFNQVAATYAATNDRLPAAEEQELKALDGFDRAEKLFDRIRRAVASALDEYDVDDPTIDNLQDPTLDEFLARLEREPNIEAQLGIPNRPRNLRVLAQAMTGQNGSGGDLLSDARKAARQRARKAMEMADSARSGNKQEKRDKPESEMTDEEREQRKKEKQMQEALEKSLASVKEKIEDPETSEEQRRKLEKMASNMKRLLDQNDQNDGDTNSTGRWEQIVESEKAKKAIEALASGQKIPDSQWNKLLSTLDDGVWQVGGRTPPEDYRKAIERYQERIRQLMNTVGSGAE